MIKRRPKPLSKTTRKALSVGGKKGALARWSWKQLALVRPQHSTTVG